MSVRAYRINKVERESDATFNLWHQTKLMQFIEDNNPYGAMSQLDDSGAGTFTIEVEVLEDAIKEAKALDLNKEDIKIIKRDIQWAKDHKDTEIEYDCF